MRDSKAFNWRWLDGGLDHPDVINLLSEHQDRMAEHSPEKSRHVLDVKALQGVGITFWSLWDGDELMGCVALKQWSRQLGELKSMKTSPAYIRRGVGNHLLKHVIAVAKQRGYQQLKLETGSMAYFEPARQLYKKMGFIDCGPFGDYVTDPSNVFMCLEM